MGPKRLAPSGGRRAGRSGMAAAAEPKLSGP